MIDFLVWKLDGKTFCLVLCGIPTTTYVMVNSHAPNAFHGFFKCTCSEKSKLFKTETSNHCI